MTNLRNASKFKMLQLFNPLIIQLGRGGEIKNRYQIDKRIPAVS